MSIFSNKKAMHAIYLGTLCSVSYLAVYFARNMLSAVTPQMIDSAGFTEPFIGKLSSMYFICYAIGQLINGFLGDMISPKWMILAGIALGGSSIIAFPLDRKSVV